MINYVNENRAQTIIKVIGVGGCGGNTVNNLIKSGVQDLEFIAANTDIQALENNLSPNKIQLGEKCAKGLGAGCNPQIGREAAEEARETIKEQLFGANMIFVTCGMGGGTGTGAAPIIAEIAQELGALTLAVVTMPFEDEGVVRKRQAETGIKNLREFVDSIIVIPLEKVYSVVEDPDEDMDVLLDVSDDILVNAVRGISEIITIPGRINADFADVQTTLLHQGRALIGQGVASGPNRAQEALQEAIENPLFDDISLEGAMKVLVNISASKMSGSEFRYISAKVRELVDPEAHIVKIGKVSDPNMGDDLKVTVIASGYDLDMDSDNDYVQATVKNKNIQINSLFAPGHSAEEGAGKRGGSTTLSSATPTHQSSLAFEGDDMPSFIRYGRFSH